MLEAAKALKRQNALTKEQRDAYIAEAAVYMTDTQMNLDENGLPVVPVGKEKVVAFVPDATKPSEVVASTQVIDLSGDSESESETDDEANEIPNAQESKEKTDKARSDYIEEMHTPEKKTSPSDEGAPSKKEPSTQPQTNFVKNLEEEFNLEAEEAELRRQRRARVGGKRPWLMAMKTAERPESPKQDMTREERFEAVEWRVPEVRQYAFLPKDVPVEMANSTTTRLPVAAIVVPRFHASARQKMSSRPCKR
jgi:hypothetical protein